MVDTELKPTFSGCGMCGAVAFGENSTALSDLDMPGMVASMHHRGPNGNGIFNSKSTLIRTLKTTKDE